MNKLNMESKDIVGINIEHIGKLFPNVIVESDKGKSIDFDLLKQELSREVVDDRKEKYELTWPGKKESIVEANTPTKNTLIPERDKSVDFDNTKNIYIEGDNLEALKILQNSYLNKIKCIYIDPPYNTGNDFIYKDNFKKDSNQELEESGQIDDEGNRMVPNPRSEGKFHSNWLSNMYPRLKLARNLLTDEGVIFISIDDNEVDNLKKICDEIFGEKNFITCFIRKGTGGRQDSKFYAIVHEYILAYAKEINNFTSGKIIKDNEIYPFYDKTKKLHYKTQLLRKWGENSRRIDRPNLYYPITDPDGNLNYPMLSDSEEGCWRWGKETMKKNIDAGLVEFKKRNNSWIAYEKIYESTGDDYKTKLYSSIIDNISNNTGASLLKNIFGFKVFNYPKPVDLIKMILKLYNLEKNDIILDFFSGSATTAHAAMQLNAEDGGKRKYIMVQVPEECKEDSEAYKQGYKTICDIGEERIRRAGKKIKEETNADIDYGFKVFKIDSSNMKDDFYKKPNDLDQSQLRLFESNVKDGRTSDDLLTQVILDLGLTLDLNVETKKIKSNNVYFVENNSLIACFDDSIDFSIIHEIANLKPLRIVFKDESFKNDNDKINLEEKFKKISPDTKIMVL